MKKNFYITQDGILKRRENTIYFVNKDKRVPIPIEQIHTIYITGNVTLSSQVLRLLSQKKIEVHIFNKHGFYTGSFYPREKYVSGSLIIKQAEHYLNHQKRIYLAKSFVRGAALNIKKNLAYFKISGVSNEIDLILAEMDSATSISEIMNIEARIRIKYYESLDSILPEDFSYVRRTRQPPENRFNALLSFLNSLLYSTILAELYHTQLNPTISYLHEPSERRFSLAYDISEIFKPFIVDRLIFYLINKRIIKTTHFIDDLNACLLNSEGKRIVLRYYDDRLKSTIKHKTLNRSVSYQFLIRLEAYKLIKHLLGLKVYKPFVIWW
ncbi:MAG: type I-B CRISPR-associated endonuclease Cas1b [Candidatus Asgardarchaeum sp.]|nr:type I-B CRISPR-associated endonuclease Cas1 [Candidatus Odinarchaeota archaeon]